MVTARFALGQTVATPGALRALEALGLPPLVLLARHATGDWGDLGAADKQMNDEAVRTGEDRVLSAYTVREHRFYVITEHDRSLTTVLLCSEY